MTQTTTNERGLICTADEVRAILRGATQFRRVIKPQPDGVTTKSNEPWIKRFITRVDDTVQPPRLIETDKTKDGKQICKRLECPYGVPGDRLWVREATYIADAGSMDPHESDLIDDDGNRRAVGYAATMDADSVRCAKDYGVRLRPSIHMPRWASRITLEVKRVWVERVQEISPSEIVAEGVGRYDDAAGAFIGFWPDGERRGEIIGAFQTLWDSINASKGYGWDTNPWVRCVEFERLEGER